MLRRLAPFLAAALAGCGGVQESRPEGAVGGRAAPAPERQAWPLLREVVESGERRGGTRAAGSAGGRASEDLVAERLREAGWTVRLEEVRFPEFRERRRPRLRAGATALRDLRTLRFSPSGRVSARVHDVGGLGCRPAEWRGFPRGRVALAARGTCTFTVKARAAQRAGARALLVADAAPRPVTGSLSAPGAVRIPVVLVGARGAAAVRAEGRARLDVATVSRRGRARNVVAELRGADPAARALMAGAHLDSVPAGVGANDNASGVAALLAIAGRLRPGELRRTVRLGFWAAEELGLHGSRAYVRRSRGDLPWAYLNLDMVGSPNPVVETYGAGRPERALRAALRGREGRARMGGASDHAAFRRAGVPVAGVFTGARARGPGGRPRDPCYHRACDDLDNVDRRTLTRVTDGVERALRALAR